MITKILTIVSLATLIAGAVFAGYQYKQIHLPEFEALKVKVDYHECIRKCKDTCKANGISVDKCKCDHCNIYRQR